MATTCPQCGTRYGDNQRLCPHDGTVLEPDRAPELAAVGRVLDGKYRLDAYLSRGGMGTVYEATHVMLNRKVAVKLISPALVQSQDTVRRFQREARAVTHLNHPNIVRVHDLGQTTDGSLYIAMDLIAGENLSAVLERAGTLEPSRIVHILRQVVSALVHAHEHGIVHRDLKPQNIMIGRAKDGADVATLLDFGIAKTFEVDAQTKVTSTGFAVGTPHYMSPEQAGAGPVDARSDLYAVGVILYQMLAGEPPFADASTPAILVKHLTETPVPPSVKRPDRAVSPGLERIAMRCLEKKPEARFQSAEELLRALDGATAAETVAPTVPVKAPRQRSLAAIAVALALVSGLGGFLLTRSTMRDAPPQSTPVVQPQPAPAAPAPAPAPPAEMPAAKSPVAPAAKVPPKRIAQEPSPAIGRPDNASSQPEATGGRPPMSRLLTQRVRSLLAQRKMPQRRFQGANLDVTVRPSGAGRGITADYVATVRTPAGDRTFSGTQSEASELALRRQVIEKAAADIVAYLATLR